MQQAWVYDQLAFEITLQVLLSLVTNVQQLCYSRLGPVDHKYIIASP